MTKARAILTRLVAATPSFLCCEDFDHKKGERHDSGEQCKPNDRFQSAMDDARALLAEGVCARTPPDFDAALGELECDQMNLDRCHDEWNKALVANDEAEAQLCEASVKIATSLRDASRQRVRELYEAVVRDG